MNEINFSIVDMADTIEASINNARPGEVINLPSGKLYLARKVIVKKKENLTILGNDTVIITHFSAADGFSKYKGAFEFSKCQNLTIENLIFDTTDNVNSTGIVTAVDSENCTFDVRLYDDCALDGHQIIRAMNSVNSDGSPDYLLATYCVTAYKMLDASSARIICDKELNKSLKRLPIGERICFRHSLGNFNLLENSTITFHSCSNTILRNITVFSSAGYMITVFPRCYNMLIDRYRVECPVGSHRLMASNIDAIHILGLSGKLILKDCHFDGLGDDAINIHSTAGTIESIKDNKLALINGRFFTLLPKDWCKKGDTIAVYSKDMVLKGHVKVEEYSNSCMLISLIDGSFDIGDIVGNEAFYADTEITRCTVKNSRARGFLLQTENIRISDCHFFGTSLAAILLAPDIIRWHEVGPVRNVIIENCTFEKCPVSKEGNALGSIVISTSHSSYPDSEHIIHHNITIRKNTFFDTPADCIFLTSTDGIKISNNRFKNGSLEKDSPNKIRLLYCKNISIESQ